MAQDVSHRIARLFEPLLRFLFPATGRRRLVAVPADPEPAVLCAAGSTVRRIAARRLRGEDDALVRPCLVAHERSREAQRQRARRRALWLAVHGIDAGPRVIHGVEVAG